MITSFSRREKEKSPFPLGEKGKELFRSKKKIPLIKRSGDTIEKKGFLYHQKENTREEKKQDPLGVLGREIGKKGRTLVSDGLRNGAKERVSWGGGEKGPSFQEKSRGRKKRRDPERSQGEKRGIHVCMENNGGRQGDGGKKKKKKGRKNGGAGRCTSREKKGSLSL